MTPDKKYAVRIAIKGMFTDFTVTGEFRGVVDGLAVFLLGDGTMLRVGARHVFWIQDEATKEEYLKMSGWLK